MKPSQKDLELLDKNIQGKNLSMVQHFVQHFGTSALKSSRAKYGSQEIYPDYITFYPIHIAILNNDLEMLRYFKSIELSPNVIYTEESDFNSKADQFMNRQNYSVMEIAGRNACSKEVIEFLQEWVAHAKGA